jgi:hypothetical protein
LLANFAHFEVFAAFCSSQNVPLSSFVNDRKPSWPVRPVQVLMSRREAGIHQWYDGTIVLYSYV